MVRCLHNITILTEELSRGTPSLDIAHCPRKRVLSSSQCSMLILYSLKKLHVCV